MSTVEKRSISLPHELSAMIDRAVEGGEFGNASRIKFVINHLVCALTCANAEAMALGLKAGLDAQQIWDLVHESAANSRLWLTISI